MNSIWHTELAGDRAPLDLVFSRRSSEMPRRDRVDFTIDRRTFLLLEELSQETEIPSSQILLAAFHVWLWRYTQSDEILAAVMEPTSPRLRVHRFMVGGDEAFLDLCRQTAEDSSRLQEFPTPDLSLLRRDGISVEAALFVGAPVHADTLIDDQVELAMHLDTLDGAMMGRMEYDASRYHRDGVERMCGHFATLLHELLQHPSRPIATRDMATAGEKQELLGWWAGDRAPFPSEETMAGLFDQKASETPDAIALEFLDRRLTYQEVRTRANRVAHQLRRQGVGPESLVALLFDRSPEMIIAMIAVWKAGGAYVPIDPAYPSDRMAYMLDDSGARVVLTEAKFEGMPWLKGRTLITLDRDLSPRLLEENAEDPTPLAGPNNLAYVIYTSGSTGRPKGVMIEHHSIVNLAVQYARLVEPWPGMGVLQACSISFDASLADITLSLVSGGRLVIVPRDRTVPGPDLVDYIREHQVEYAELVPSVWAMLDEKDVPTVRIIATGGEACSEDIVRRLGAGRKFLNAYGPTEASVSATIARLDGRTGIPPIGRPLPNYRIYVLDAEQHLCPVGVPGELYIGGEGVARGYLNRPELTEERFVPDPFSPEPGARMYRSGDLVRFLPDGQLAFLGRVDDQVKIRGFRIEIGEIEALVSECPGVRVAAVVVREDRPNDQRLVAYVVGDVEPQAVRSHVAQSLPHYMVPSAVVVRPFLDLTPNGKVDRRALLALPTPTYVASQSYVAPRSPLEVRLVEIWESLLGVHPVGIADDFFELGGHSLLAVRLSAEIREHLGYSVVTATLLNAPTVRELAAILDQEASQEWQEVPRLSRDQALPMSHAQEQMWLIDQIEPGSPAYHEPVVWHIEGSLDPVRLDLALVHLEERHEVLRTILIRGEDALPEEVVNPPRSTILRIEEANSQESAWMAVRQEALQPFDLETGPLWRALLVRLSGGSYLLALTFHHVVSDGWSMGILARDLRALYGREALPPLSRQYSDVAAWQRGWLLSGVLAEELAHWKETLKGDLPIMPWPTDRPRSSTTRREGGVYRFRMSRELTERIEALGRVEGTTLFMTLLAFYQCWLYRYTGETDVLVGAPVAGRWRPEMEDLIGYFVNTLVYRTPLSADLSVRDLLARVRSVALDALSHEHVPFETLVQEISPPRQRGVPLLVQTVFALQNAPDEPLILPGCQLEERALDLEIAKFDLTLELTQDNEGLAGRLEYRTDLFDAVTAERMARQFLSLVESAVSKPDQAVGSLTMVSQEEREALLLAGTGDEIKYPLGRTVSSLFDDVAERRPDSIAIEYMDRKLTYREVRERSNQLARLVRDRGVGPDTLVALALERSPEMVIAMLAIWKAGGAYVPLDPAYPTERLAYMLEDSQASILMTERQFETAPWALGRTVIMIDGAIAADQRGDDLEPVSTAQNLAYVIYTSGSTGRPKGVMVEHRTVVNLASGQAHALRLSADTRMLQFASFSFDAAVWEIVSCLLAGGCLVMGPRTALLPGPELARYLRAHAVNTALIGPAALAAMDPNDLEPITCLLSGGEALTEELARRLSAGRRLFNAFGPTESTVIATMAEMGGVEGTPAIGRPVANIRVYVLDSEGQLAPWGVAGELYIGGAGLARGYLNRPDLTEARFVPDPFAPEPDARMYRTGDLVRWLRDGQLVFLGRVDDQVKIRGFRIELGEIETAIQDVPGVSVAAVVVREDQPGDRRLVAYVQGEESPDVIRRALGERMPRHMIPAAVVMQQELPLTPNGKLDRRALLALPAPDYMTRSTYVAPRNSWEQQMAFIWQDLLGLQRVGVDDDFFELGGHSLLATRLVMRIQENLGRRLSVADVFATPTISGLVGILQSINPDEEVPLEVIPRTGALPASYAQEQMWLIDQIESIGSLYHVPSVWRISGRLDAASLDRALVALENRHEVLRTALRAGPKGALEQVVMSGRNTILRQVSASDEESALCLAREDAKEPFDLAHGRLWRALIIHVGSERSILAVTFHHVVADGWSLGVFAAELSALYAGESLTEIPFQYGDVSAWQRRWLEGGVLARELGYWKDALAGDLPVLSWPTDRPRSETVDRTGGAYRFRIDRELSEQIAALGREEGTTLFMTLLTLYQAWIYRYTGESDVLVGSPVAGRWRAEMERLMGYFVNTLVYRTPVSGKRSLRDLLHTVRSVVLETLAHEHVPFEVLVQTLAPRRQPGVPPLVQSMFVLQNGGETFRLPGVAVEDVTLDLDIAKFDLTLELTQDSGGLAGRLEYNAELFDEETAARMVDQFLTLAQNAVEDPEAALDALSMASGEARQELLQWARGEMRPYPSDATLSELFDDAADRYPGEVALEFMDRRLTYREVRERANRLAHHLMGLGVGPDSLVAIMFERAPEMIIAMIAIWKAGGAYVPVDPAYPADRIAYMLEDSRAPIVVTEGRLTDAEWLQGRVVVALDEELSMALKRESLLDPPRQAHARNPAYVIYTSGSTGRPKGVMVEHRSVVNMAFDHAERLRSGPGVGMLQAFSISFDASMADIAPTLISGGRLVIVPKECMVPGPELESYIEKHQVEIVTLVPAAWALMNENALPTVRTVVTGGEICSPELVRRLGSGRSFYNVYGPTEAAVIATAERSCTASAFPPSIGRPLANVEAYVLDDRGALCPPGVTGELYLGGDGVARGYLNRPELTVERFCPHPFSPDPTARLYRTGDLVRWRSDGQLVFLGRVDDQVKVRGFRIELGEIEAVLNEIPGVKEAVVIARPDGAELALAAYLRVGEEISLVDIRKRVRERLPAHMVPSAFAKVERFPTTPNGKVDRRKLMEVAVEPLSGDEAEKSPRNAWELALLPIWEEVLGTSVGVDDNFFELGGHSLKAIALRQAVSETLGVQFPLPVLFQDPTPAGLAAWIAKAREGQWLSSCITLKAAPDEGAPEVILIHEVSGGVLEYRDLVADLRLDDVGVRAFVAPGYDTEEAPVESIERLASIYVGELNRLEITGPLYLVGWSFGGLVAFEMVRLLEKAGWKVPLLTLLDAYPYGTGEFAPWNESEAMRQLASRLEVTVADDSEMSLSRLSDMTVGQGLLPERTARATLSRQVGVLMAHSRALAQYRPAGKVGSDVLLLEAEEREPGRAPIDVTKWASRTTGALYVRPIAGSHFTMVHRPHAAGIAEELRAFFQAESIVDRG